MEDRCVCCGRIIPEGRFVCPLCENSEASYDDGYDFSSGSFMDDESAEDIYDGDHSIF